MTTSSGRRLEWLEASDAVLSAQSVLDFHKGSGHGGQKINKTSSSVRLTHTPSGIVIVCHESRSQSQNRHLAFAKLRKRIALDCRCAPDNENLPDANDIPSLTGDRYPLFLALLLDHVQTSGSVPGFTRSALIRLLRRDSEVWRCLSERRETEYSLFFGVSNSVPGQGGNTCIP